MTIGLQGCSALRPIDGIPARYLADEFRGPSRSAKAPIDLSLLAQTPPAQHLVDAGDVLGIYIDGVLDSTNHIPAVASALNESDLPSTGYPITVRPDGTISLPEIVSLDVRGQTLKEVEHTIRTAYSSKDSDTALLVSGRDQLLVSLQRPRSHRVIVMRQESANEFGADGSVGTFNPNGVGGVFNTKRGMGRIVKLPVYRNDVLTALAETGGPPGLDAEDAVYVIRNRRGPGCAPVDGGLCAPFIGHTPYGSVDDLMGGGHVPAPFMAGDQTIYGANVIRIPLQLAAGEVPRFTEPDIKLYDGDIVYVDSRQDDVYYTGGLLGGGQFVLPRDFDLDVLGAISIAQARGGANSPRSIGGISALNRDVTAAASHVLVLRQLPDGTQVPIEIDLYEALANPRERLLIQPGDYVFLQYTKKEACLAFLERHLLEGATLGLIGALITTQ